MSSAVDELEDEGEELVAAPDTFIPLSDPDVTLDDLAAVESVMRSSRLSSGPVVEDFEEAFAAYLGRKYAVATSSGTSGLLLALAAYGIGPGDEVIASPHSFRETQHAIALCGAQPVFVDIDYWSGTIAASKVEAAITERTKAIVASNTNGHPAPWDALKEIAKSKRILLLEDSTEAIGSKYKDRLVGTFGAASVFDFSQPGPLVCGEGGVVVTDDIDVAVALRRLRSHRHDERASVVVSSSAPYQTGMSDITAALALSQLGRLDEILEKRKLIEHYYFKHIKSFEGIKDPFIAPDVTEASLVPVCRASRHTIQQILQRFDHRGSQGREGRGRGLQHPAAHPAPLCRLRLSPRRLARHREGVGQSGRPALPYPSHGASNRVHRRDDEGRLGERWRGRGDLLKSPTERHLSKKGVEE